MKTFFYVYSKEKKNIQNSRRIYKMYEIDKNVFSKEKKNPVSSILLKGGWTFYTLKSLITFYILTIKL